jgi:hypothetical protein
MAGIVLAAFIFLPANATGKRMPEAHHKSGKRLRRNATAIAATNSREATVYRGGIIFGELERPLIGKATFRSYKGGYLLATPELRTLLTPL